MFSQVLPGEEGAWTGMLVLTFTARLTWKGWQEERSHP